MDRVLAKLGSLVTKEAILTKKMASKATNAKKSKGSKSAITQEQLVIKFNQLRQEQRSLLSKINELEVEQSEHR